MRRIMLRDRPYERNMDPAYIQEVAAAYQAWLSNLEDTHVLTVDNTNLDFLANKSDLDHVITLIEEALAQQAPAVESPSQAQTALLQQGHLNAYQQFHRQLDSSKQFDPDLFFNYILLTEEMGEIASELVNVWRTVERLKGDGRSTPEARQEALNQYRASLRSELADLLAYTLKLANYAGIDLETAYQEKMKHNIGREWPKFA
jgi:NTP pyrophosphatase (non-canonical NTP hydrolase)